MACALPLSLSVSTSVEPIFDAEDTLGRLSDDHELFLELVESFRRDSSKGLSEIRRAAADGDARALTRAAHTLKGVVSLFASAPAIRATQAIENAGRTGVTDIPVLLKTLEEVLAKLEEALSRYSERLAQQS